MPNPDYPACQGKGQWYSPDNGQIVTCDCGKEARARTTNETFGELYSTPTHRTPINRSKLASFEKPYFSALERFVQLHQTVEIVYVVDGYLAKYMVTDGQVCERTVKGGTILEAIRLLEVSLQERPPQFGGPK